MVSYTSRAFLGGTGGHHAPFDVSAARARVLEARHHAHFGHHVQLSQEGGGRYLRASVRTCSSHVYLL